MKAAQILVVLVVCLVSISGCTLSPSQRYEVASITYETTLETLVDLEAAGFIDREDLVELEPYRKPVGVLLDEIDAAIVAGETPSGAEIRSLELMLETFAEEVAELEAKESE